MKKIFALIPLLLLVVSVSGCVQGGGFGGLMGVGVEEKEAPNDVIDKKGTQIIPEPPILAGNPFTLKFYIENLYSAEGTGESARDVYVELYDWGRCDPQNDKTPIEGKGIYPGATRTITWKFDAPDNKKLGYVSGQCPIRYQVRYIYDAHTRADAIAASEERFRQVSRSGESISVSPGETKSRGPIKIDIRFASDQPFREGTTVPFDVIVKDKGSGHIKGREVSKGDLDIQVRGSGISLGKCKYPADAGAPFIGDETPPIRCDLEIPKDMGSDIKTYSIQVDLSNYTYVLSYQNQVSIETRYESPGGEVKDTGGSDSEGDEGDGGAETTPV